LSLSQLGCQQKKHNLHAACILQIHAASSQQLAKTNWLFPAIRGTFWQYPADQLRDGLYFYFPMTCTNTKKNRILPCYKGKIRFVHFDRGRGSRTPIDGFGGRKSTPEKDWKINTFSAHSPTIQIAIQIRFSIQIRHFAQHNM
jgi:hypothetical protein